MATREALYEKFGMTAEVAQLFETELGTLLLGVTAIERGWHTTPAPSEARRSLDQIESHTLGRLLGALRGKIEFDEHVSENFATARKGRNRLNHSYFD